MTETEKYIAELVAKGKAAQKAFELNWTTQRQVDEVVRDIGKTVYDHRRELSRRTLGIPVIALGIPTVVDLHTAAQSIYGRPVPKGQPNMMVTPRDVDRLIDHAGDLLACALNMALHPGMSFEQAESLG